MTNYSEAFVEANFALEKLMRIHYKFFMVNPRFWYEKDLQAADMIICVAASNLRKEMRHGL